MNTATTANIQNNNPTAFYHLPQACLNFTNCTAYSFHYSGNTGNIFTTGVRLARSMALLRIVSGAAGVLHLDILSGRRA